MWIFTFWNRNTGTSVPNTLLLQWHPFKNSHFKWPPQLLCLTTVYYMWKCVAVFTSYYATEHFEGAVMATKRTPWWCHLWCVEIWWRLAKVWRTFCACNAGYKNLITVHRTTTYPVFWRQGVQISTNSPKAKTQIVDVISLSGKMSKQYFVSGGFLTHHTELIIQN